MKRFLRRLITNRGFYVAILFASGLYICFSGANPAQAAVTLQPSPWPCCIPASNYDGPNGLHHADAGPNYARLTIWVSDQAPPVENYKQQVIQVQPGPSVGLSFSYAGAVGNVGNNAVVSRARVVGATEAPNLVGREMTLDWGADHDDPGAYRHQGVPFDYVPAGGITSSGQYDLQVTIKQIIQYSNGVFECVTPSGVAPYTPPGNDIGFCPDASTSFSFYLQVPEQKYDHRAQVKICETSPTPPSPNGGVEPGKEYTLCPLVRNRGQQTATWPETHLLAVINQYPNNALPVVGDGGVGPLVPEANQDTIYGFKKSYAENEPACNPNFASPTQTDCWAWGFHDLQAGAQADSSFRFKVDEGAGESQSKQVCFLPFVRRRSLNHETFTGDQLCFHVITDTCPADSDFPGTKITDLQTDTNGDGQINSQDCYIPREKSYLSVYGNDVIAGSGFGSGCSATEVGEAAIESFADNPTVGGESQWKGASVQFAAIARGSVRGFYTANMRGPSGTDNLPRPPLDLLFGNSANGVTKVNMAQGEGGLSGLTTCAKDYFAEADVIQPPSATHIGTRNISPGSHQALYYDDDVYITGTGIRFQGADGNWGAEVENIPSFLLVVKGNIYISDSVTQLDGLYVAQPLDDGTKGEIFTCATPSGQTPPGLGACDKQLIITGAFLAKQVRFLRTFGNLDEAVSNEGSNNSKAAEVFNFSPEMYLSPLHQTQERNLPFTKYDYITSLPPIL